MIASVVATSAGVAIGGAAVWANAAPTKESAGSASAAILSWSTVRATVASVSRGPAPSRLAHDSTATNTPGTNSTGLWDAIDRAVSARRGTPTTARHRLNVTARA